MTTTKKTCLTANKTRLTKYSWWKTLLIFVIMAMQASTALGAQPEKEEKKVGKGTQVQQNLVSDRRRLVLDPDPTPHPAHLAHCTPDHPSRSSAARSVPVSVTSPTAYPITYSVNSLAEHLHFNLSRFVPTISKQVDPNMAPKDANGRQKHRSPRPDLHGTVRTKTPNKSVALGQTASPPPVPPQPTY